jgi:hypothetical protein
MRFDGSGQISGSAVASGTSDLIPDVGTIRATSTNASLIYKGRINSGQDLNNYYEPGVYRINSGADAAAILNTPASSSGATLEVLSADPIRARGSRALVVQRYTQRTNSAGVVRVFQRRSNSIVVDDWGPWHEVVTSAYVGPFRFQSYTVAELATYTAAAAGAGTQIYVSNESGGAVLAFSDGTNWRRVTDRAVVS